MPCAVLDIHGFPAHEHTQHRPSEGLGECYYYNTPEEIDRLVEAVANLVDG